MIYINQNCQKKASSDTYFLLRPEEKKNWSSFAIVFLVYDEPTEFGEVLQTRKETQIRHDLWCMCFDVNTNVYKNAKIMFENINTNPNG